MSVKPIRQLADQSAKLFLSNPVVKFGLATPKIKFVQILLLGNCQNKIFMLSYKAIITKLFKKYGSASKQRKNISHR